jgi:hypothetical protein
MNSDTIMALIILIISIIFFIGNIILIRIQRRISRSQSELQKILDEELIQWQIRYENQIKHINSLEKFRSEIGKDTL